MRLTVLCESRLATFGLMVMEDRRTMSKHCTTSCRYSCALPDLHGMFQDPLIFTEVCRNLSEWG